MTRVLVTGGAGLVGSTLLATAPPGVELHATQRRSPVLGAEAHRIDLADADATEGRVAAVAPDVVVHTAYDLADLDRDVVAATRTGAAACAATGAALVHLSSDVVFDGEHAPYAEDHPPAPITPYGRAKAQAEADVVAAVPDAAVVRTSLVCAVDPLDPRSAWIVDGLRAGEERCLFTDEVRCPVRADDLALMLWEVVALPRPERAGPWHLDGPDDHDRPQLGCMLAAAHGLDPTGLSAARSRDQPEPRPRDLRLTSSRPLQHRARPLATLFAR